MTSSLTSQPEAAAQRAKPPPDAAAPEGAGDDGLPMIETTLGPQAILERLETASRRGRLPGFERGNGALFDVAAHGQPFDGVLAARYEQAGPGEAARVRFTLRLLPGMPLAFAALLIFTIWPGVYFMDELIAQFIPGWWRPWVTYYWYLPLTVLPTPWIWRSVMRRARRTAREAAAATINKVAAELGGRVIPAERAA